MLSVQTLQLQPDAALIHRHEFSLVMHLIVCRTKRELRSLPLEFPKYLFPQLSQSSWIPGHANSMQQPESSFDLDDGFTASLRPPEKLFGVPALTDLLEYQVSHAESLLPGDCDGLTCRYDASEYKRGSIGQLGRASDLV